MYEDNLMSGASRFCLFGALAATLAAAQDFRASLVGQVTDSSHAAIPGAIVRATQTNKSKTTQTETDFNGYFSISYLDPGKYVVEASHPGFRILRREDVTLMVDQKMNLTLILQVGDVNTEITVHAEIENIDTADASRGSNFDTRETSEYPLNGRQAYMLMQLAPGVLYANEDLGATGSSGNRGWDANDNFVVNGGVKGTTNFLLNGASISARGQFQLVPNLDAIQEFKVMTNTYDAQYGRTGGGTVNTSLRSGSAKWHGTLFEFMRNALLDANSTQNNLVGAPKGKHITNQFGGTGGGPIRRGRDFIFASFEGFRERLPIPVVSDTVPLDLRNGQNFSKYAINVFDPLTVRKCVSGVDTPKGTGCFAGYIRDPFPGNVIPASRISPVGRKILDLYPAPNGPGLTQNFFASGNTGRYTYNQPMGRWDHVAGERDRMYAVATFQHGQEIRNHTGFPDPAAQGDMKSQRTPQHYVADWTRVLSPASILDVRISGGRFTQWFPDGENPNFTASQLGMTMPHPPIVGIDTAPRVQLDTYSDIIGNLYSWSTYNNLSAAASVTHTHGGHTRHIGFEFVYSGVAKGDIGRANGQFTFDRTWTQNYTDRSRNRSDGMGVASMLLGIPSSGYIDYNDTYYRTWPYYALYFQDDWRVRPNLTLNLGVRYDVQVPFVERLNRVNSGFDFNAVNPLSDAILAQWRQMKAQYDATKPKYLYPDPPSAILGGKEFVANGSRRTYDTDWTDVQPRVGVAWAFAPKTVLRTGFGIYYRTATQDNQTDGFNQRTNYYPSTDGNITLLNGSVSGPFSLADPFPNGILAPAGSSLGLLTNAGSAVTFDGHQRPIPRTYQYSFGFQRWVGWGVKTDISYVGSQTVHDSMSVQRDYVTYAQFVAGHADNSFLNRKLPNPFFGLVLPTSDFGKSNTINAENLLHPWPLFNGITEATEPWARYRYDSLQVRLEKRFFGSRTSGGLTMVLSYTFSKSFEADHRLNNWNLNEPPVHQLSAYDKPQNLALSGVWDLPFGRGRAFLSQGNTLLRAAVSNWNLNWNLTYYSGFPTAWPNAQFVCGSYFAADGQTSTHWFNNDASCYKDRPGYSLRDTGDRFAWIRNPAVPSLNMALARTLVFSERYSLQLRGEAFNATNTPRFGGPITDFKNPRFGMLPLQQNNFPRLIQVAAKIIW